MMQTILIAVLTAAQAYLLGSVDTGILISKCITMTCATTAAALPV